MQRRSVCNRVATREPGWNKRHCPNLHPMFREAIPKMSDWQNNDFFIHYDNVDLAFENIHDCIQEKNLEGVRFHTEMLKLNLDMLLSEIEEVLDEYEKKDAEKNETVREIKKAHEHDTTQEN
jgi:hypothetical protein